MRINIVGTDDDAGVTQDTVLLQEILGGAGHVVSSEAFNSFAGVGHRFDCAVHLGTINSFAKVTAPVNVFVPDPEWFAPLSAGHLHDMVVLTKSRAAVAAFEQFCPRVLHVGWTSRDIWRSAARVNEFFHLAGRSLTKNTQLVLDLWARRPDWPRLTVVHHPRREYRWRPALNLRVISRRLEDDELSQLMNRARFHLCPSEVEGYGHYINEASSLQALVLTTDGPPMNELVGPDRGVMIEHVGTRRIQQAVAFVIDEPSLDEAIERALTLTPGQVEERGANARAWFLENDARFRQEFVERVEELAARQPAQ